MRDTTTEERYNALHYAVKEGRIKTVEFLLEAGIDKNAQTFLSKDTALHLAIRCALKKIMTILLKHGCNPNAQNALGMTPLHILTGIIDSKELT